jgi:hypothetical protein
MLFEITISDIKRTPRKKGFRKNLPSLERPVHVVPEWELKPKLRVEEGDFKKVALHFKNDN